MELVPSAKIIERKITAPKIDVAYPEIKGLKESLFVQVRINELIRSVVYNIIHDQIKDKTEQPEIKGRYMVTCNEKGILSIVFIHDVTEKSNRSSCSVKSINLDLGSARNYGLDDLFACEDGLTDKINALAFDKVKRGTVTLKRCFNGIDRDQEYYLTGAELVLYYQPGRYTCVQEIPFEIRLPLSELKRFTGQECPLAAFKQSESIEEPGNATDAGSSAINAVENTTENHINECSAETIMIPWEDAGDTKNGNTPSE